MKFNRDTCTALRDEINAALRSVGEKNGVEIAALNASFSDEFINFKLRVSAKAEDGTTISQEATDFKRFGSLYGFSPDDLGKPFKNRGVTFYVHGLKQRARSMPIIGRKEGGGLFKFTPEAVLRALGKEVPDFLKPEVVAR